jgi:hypothetical protein
MDTDTKKILSDIATLYGVKVDIIRDVWEYTVFAWALNMLDTTNKTRQLNVPFLGKIALRYEGTEVNEEGSIGDSVKAFVLLNPDFKELIADLYTGNKSVLAEYIKTKHLDKVMDEAEV